MTSLVELFFPLSTASSRMRGGLVSEGNSYKQQTLLLAGDILSPKRIMCMHYAYNAALRGCRVLVFSPHPSQQIFPPLPSLLPSDDLDTAAMEKIHIKYVQNSLDVLSCIGEIHSESSRPNLIIVEGLAGLAGGGQDAVSKLSVALAQLTNLVTFISEESPAPCELIVTEEVTSEGRPHQLYVYERWMDLIFTVRDTTDDFCEIQRVKCPACNPNCRSLWAARFQIRGLSQGQGAVVRFCCDGEIK